MGKLIVGIILCGLVALVGAGPAYAAKDHLIVAFEDAVKTMDYYQTTARVGIQTGYMIWDPLLERDAKDGSLHPHLVTSWKNINPTAWEFKLRPDVKFHNGNPLNAEAVRFTLEDRILDPVQKSPTLPGWRWVKKVEVMDDLTFRIITEQPYPLILERLNVLFIYDPKWTKEMVAKNGESYLSRNAMGTGPFKFVKFEEGIKIELVRNENYWKKGWPKFNKMTIRFIPEMATRMAELVSGGIDACDAILPDQIATIEKNKSTKVIEVPILRVNFWQFDGDGRAPGTPPALKDVRVRRAIWQAIDRKAIIQNVLGGHADLVDIPMNPKQFGADTSIKGPEFNPEKAKALLKEAGYENGFTVNLWTYTAITKQVNEAAAGYLEKVGIKAVIKDFVGRVGEMEKLSAASRTDGILNMTWGSYNIFDADAILPYFFLTPEAVYCYNNDSELNLWLREARNTLEQKLRKTLYSKAQKRIVERVYWMPFFTQRDIHGCNKNLSYELGPDQVPRYQYATWKE
jgi:peptide/nickel transport system substrate-binding protein